MGGCGKEGTDVMHYVRGPGGVFHDPPDHKGDSKPPKDSLKSHVFSQKRRPDLYDLSENHMLTLTDSRPTLTGCVAPASVCPGPLLSMPDLRN